jgi:hypothetical protein
MEGKNVLVGEGLEDGFLFLQGLFHGEDLVADARGFFKIEPFRSTRHFFPQEFDQLGALSFQKEENFLNQFSVLFRRDEPAAGGEAFFYLIVQARAGTMAKVGLLAGA